MDYYEVILYTRCVVVVKADSKGEAYERALTVRHSDSGVLKSSVLAIDEEDLIGCKRSCNVDLTEEN